jgi:hypothetical protein
MIAGIVGKESLDFLVQKTCNFTLGGQEVNIITTTKNRRENIA